MKKFILTVGLIFVLFLLTIALVGYLAAMPIVFGNIFIQTNIVVYISMILFGVILYFSGLFLIKNNGKISCLYLIVYATLYLGFVNFPNAI